MFPNRVIVGSILSSAVVITYGVIPFSNRDTSQLLVELSVETPRIVKSREFVGTSSPLVGERIFTP
jgi:hypothetical protein